MNCDKCGSSHPAMDARYCEARQLERELAAKSTPASVDEMTDTYGQEIAAAAWAKGIFKCKDPLEWLKLAKVIDGHSATAALREALAIANRSADDQMFQKREAESRLTEQAQELEMLRKDKERLDWLEKNLQHLTHGRATNTVLMGGQCVFGQVGDPRKYKVNHRSIREGIDAARAALNEPGAKE